MVERVPLERRDMRGAFTWKARPKRRGKPGDDGERSVIADKILDRDFEADHPNQKSPLGRLRRNRLPGAGHAGPDDGRLAPRQGGRSAASLGPGGALQQRAVSAPAGRQWHHLLHEPGWHRLGHFGHGEPFFIAENRTHQPQDLSDARRSPRGRHAKPGPISSTEFEARAMLA